LIALDPTMPAKALGFFLNKSMNLWRNLSGTDS
jgi:hypothetical protein